MKKATKRLLTLTLAMLFMISMPMVVFADYGNFPSMEWQLEMINQMQELQDRNQILQDEVNRLQSAPQRTPAPQNPNIRLVQPQSLVLSPGEVAYVDIEIRNIGNGQASNALVSASSEGPFSIEFINNSNVIGNMAQNRTQSIRVRLTVDSNAQAGSSRINLEFAYRNRDGNNLTSDDTISVRIDAQATQAHVMLRDFTTDRAHITPGDSFTISANLVNLGTGAAQSVQAAIRDGLDAEGIFLSGSPNAPFLQTMEAGYERTVQFTFTASTRIRGGTHPLVFEITGRDAAGDEITQQFTYFVNVIVSPVNENQARIALTDMSAPGGVIGVGQGATFSMYVTNNGGGTAHNIRVAATPTNGTALVPRSANVQTVPVLPPGASQRIQFTFAPTADARSQYHTIGFEVTYEPLPEADTNTFSQYIGINVYNPEEEEEEEQTGRTASRPRIIVSNYRVDPLIVEAGREFDLHMTFTNTSSTRRVQNIKVTLLAVEQTERRGAVFTPVGASNTLFFDSLMPGQSVDTTLRMFAVPDADPRTYNLEVTFDYEDDDFEEFRQISQISINVRQFMRLEADGINIPEFGSMGDTVFLEFQAINSGMVSLRNLRVFVEGDFDTTFADIFIGNLGRGNMIRYDGTFSLMSPGEQHGTVVLQGEDELGDIIEVRHDFTIFVQDMDMGGWEGGGLGWEGDWDDSGFGGDFGGDFMMTRPGMGFDGMEGEEGGFSWTWIAIALAVVLIVIVATVLLVRRSRGRRGLDFDDF